MSFFTDTKKILNNLAQDWELFKKIHDKAQEEQTKNGQADSLTIESREKLISAMDKNSDALDILHKKNQLRPFSEEDRNFDNEEYTEAFKDYIRTGCETKIRAIATKSNITTPDSNGYISTHKMFKKTEERLGVATIRRIASSTTISATDSFEVIQDDSDVLAGWSKDLEDVVNKSKVTGVKKLVIYLHDLYAQPKTTQRLIDDPMLDIESWLALKISEIFAEKENEAFINGDGSGKPFGLLHNTGNATKVINSGANADITINGLLEMIFALPERYAKNAKIITSRDVIRACRMIKDKNDQYVWQPSLSAETPDKIMGIEVVTCSDMPSMTIGSKSIIYGDIKRAYQIIDRGSMRLLRDPYTEKPLIKFYATRRVGGAVVDPKALVIMSLKA